MPDSCRYGCIKTEPKVDDSADNCRGFNCGAPRFSFQRLGKFQATKRIGFPKVCAWAKPVEIVFAFFKRLA